jgi:hypothetical protein
MSQPHRIWQLCNEVALRVYDTKAPSARYASAVARLLFGTCAQESNLIWTRQRTPRWDGVIGGFSRWQLETGSIQDSQGMARNRPALGRNCANLIFGDPNAPDNALALPPMESILWCLRMDSGDALGCVLARLHYMRVNAPVPESVEDQAVYWKRYYNTAVGKGTTAQYLKSWARHCAPVVGV